MSEIVINRPTTSASNLYRRALCEGSGRMESGIVETDSEYSAEGNLMHELFWTGKRPETLSPDQRECLNDADRYADKFFGIVRDQLNITEDESFQDEKEVPLVFRDQKGNELFPGHADLIRTWKGREIYAVVDFKSGFSEVDEAPDNLQLCVYAVMKAQAMRGSAGIMLPKTFAVALVQPRNFGPRYTGAFYGHIEIRSAELEIERIFYASQRPDAPLTAGQAQCHFCKAKVFCEAYKSKFLAVQAAGIRAVDTLDNDELVRTHQAIGFANKIKDEVTAEMRKRIDEGKLPGWKLQSTGDVRTVHASLKMWEAFSRYFADNPKFTAAAYDACRKISWGALEDLILTIEGLSEKRAKELVKELSAPFVTSTAKEKRPVFDKAAVKALPA
jgi:hypothetical protein